MNHGNTERDDDIESVATDFSNEEGESRGGTPRPPQHFGGSQFSLNFLRQSGTFAGDTQRIPSELLPILSRLASERNSLSDSPPSCEVFFVFRQGDAQNTRSFFTSGSILTVNMLLEKAAAECGIALANFYCRLSFTYSFTLKAMLTPLPTMTDQIHADMFYMFKLTDKASNMSNADVNALNERLTKLELECADLREQKQILLTFIADSTAANSGIESLVHALLQESSTNQPKLAHLLEHLNVRIKVVSNTNNRWDTKSTKTSAELLIQSDSVTNNTDTTGSGATNETKMIHAHVGHQTDLKQTHGVLEFLVNYTEYKIDKMPSGKNIRIGVAAGTKFFNLCQRGNFSVQTGDERADRKHATPITFAQGDTVGCAVLSIQQSETAAAAQCRQCDQPKRRIAFTVNGELKGTPFALPNDLAAVMKAAIALDSGTKVTANFGPNFLYKIPPAKNLLLDYAML